MTDTYHILPIESIKVGQRFRENTGDLRSLKESIQSHGLFHAIVIDRDYNLLAGGRRHTACLELGHTSIYCRFIDEADELTKREIELEENLARENLRWEDEDRLRAEIHRLKSVKYGIGLSGRPGPDLAQGWTQADTAESLGVDQSTIARSLARIEAIEILPSIADAPTRKAADRELDRLVQAIETELNLRRRNKEAVNVSQDLFCGDCIGFMSKMSAGSVDLIVTDPPYGTNLDSITVGNNHRTGAEFEDDPVAVLALLRTAFVEMRRVLRPNSHAYIFCTSIPQDQVRLIDMLATAGFDVEPIPLVWLKDTHTTVDWDYRYAPSYESILFCSNRQRRLADKRENVFLFDNDPDRIHTAQKPVGLLSEFIAQSSSEGEIVFDPFMGSGSTIVAAIRLARRYVGMEISPQTFRAAQERIMNELAQRAEGDECQPTSDADAST